MPFVTDRTVKRIRVAAVAIGTILILTAVGLAIGARQLQPRMRDWVRSTLADALQSEVEIAAIGVQWFPLRLSGRDLTVRHHGRTDVPPLLVVHTFTVDLNPTDVWRSTVDHIRVDGMEIHIPPKDSQTGHRPMPQPDKSGNGDSRPTLHVRRLTATNARLAIVPRNANKNPRTWDIFELTMEDLGSGTPSPFVASLTNPIPYGKIETKGQFGPWHSDEPGDTPIAGEYTFAADLGTIKGLAGQLNASGNMQGVLERISTRGKTRTPDFRVTALDGRSLPLSTTYDATVDGTKGDVDLNRIDITLGRSKLVARGVVSGTKGISGKRTVLNVKSEAVDLAELLRFVTRDEPPAAQGTVILDTAFDLPQGKADVLERLELAGSFRAERLRFSNTSVQDKIDMLSRRAQGRPDDESIDNMASKVTSTFALRKGVLNYKTLSFDVEGASVNLNGTHALSSKSLNLEGEVLLKARASNTLTGFKRWLVKPFDALFSRQGAGTRLVIHVEGTQDKPQIGLELGRTLKGQ